MTALTYVYCLVRGARRPAITSGGTPAGVPGSRETRAVAAGDDLWLIVATVPDAKYNEAALATGLQNLDWVSRCAVAHEAVVEQFLSAKAVLPMQLFTLFTSDERALQHVTRQRREILTIVRRLERKLEWGLRLTFDEQAARDAIEHTHAASPARPRKLDRPGALVLRRTGAAYLTRKRDLLDVQRVQLRAAKNDADRLFEALAREAADARRRTATEQAAPGSRLLLDAAFLVATSRSRSFCAAVSRRSKAIGAVGVVVSLSGPWPPYNFIVPPDRAGTVRSTKSRGKTAH